MLMMRNRLFLLMLSLAAFCLTPACLSAEELRIAFWNVQNLLDEHDDPLSRYDEKFSPSSVRERIGKDAEVIRSLNADIIGLAEVENLPLLKRLVSSHLSKDGYQHIVLIEADDPRGIDVALISRIPCLVQTIDIPGLPRHILAARFVVKKQPFYVLVNHWKSRVDGGGEDVRLEGAKAASQFIREQIRQHEGTAVPVILVGDFNDEPADVSLKFLEREGLVNTMLTIPEDKRWTHGRYNRDANRMELYCFDQILISPDLQKKSGLRWIKTEVHRPRFMINSRRSFNGVQYPLPLDDHQERIGYSDHFPVIATFRVD